MPVKTDDGIQRKSVVSIVGRECDARAMYSYLIQNPDAGKAPRMVVCLRYGARQCVQPTFRTHLVGTYDDCVWLTRCISQALTQRYGVQIQRHTIAYLAGHHDNVPRNSIPEDAEADCAYEFAFMMRVGRNPQPAVDLLEPLGAAMQFYEPKLTDESRALVTWRMYQTNVHEARKLVHSAWHLINEARVGTALPPIQCLYVVHDTNLMLDDGWISNGHPFTGKLFPIQETNVINH